MNHNSPSSRRSFLGCLLPTGSNNKHPSQLSPQQNRSFNSRSFSPDRRASYWQALKNKKIQCQLCPHECQVADLERGSCGVRENRAGTYYTLVYGNPCSTGIDPIEKKPLFHYYPATDSFSIATAGCNFVCKFCQNWEISQKRPEQVESIRLLPTDVIEKARNRACRTVAHTYSEPVVFSEYMLECAIEGKKAGIPSVMISNGFINEKPMRELCRYLGAVKIDLKAFSETFYRDFCKGRLRPVLDTLLILRDEGIWFEIVVLLIPGLNDSEKELGEMCSWIVKELGNHIPVHFSRYFPTFMLRNIPPTPPATVLQARNIAMDRGLKYSYAGNMISDAGNTYCPGCGNLLLRRIGFSTLKRGLQGNLCKKCGEEIAGVF